MPRIQPSSLLRFIRKLTVRGTSTVADAALLDRYVRQRDEAAFELLLWRHAALVFKVCQDVLQEPFAAEDAFQATFLVLARKAGSISKRESLAGWLYQVAFRIALKARAQNSKRAACERSGLDHLADQVAFEQSQETAGPELNLALYEEIARLPAKYRAPLVLCYLEGKTHDQAAQQLGWPKGTVAGRLARTRDLLRQRLTRRGLALSGSLALTVMSGHEALATVPPALAQATCRAAWLFAAGTAAGVSPNTLLWAEGVIKAMLVTKVKFAAMLMLVLTFLGAGIGALTYGMTGTGDPVDATASPSPSGPPALVVDNQKPATPTPPNISPAEEDNKNPPPVAPVKKDQKIIRVVSQRDGVIVVVGTELKQGEKIPVERLRGLVETEQGIYLLEPGQKVPPDLKVRSVREFKDLREGDTVRAGQLLARLDDRLARNELESAKAKRATAEAEFRAAQALSIEAENQMRASERLIKNRAISQEEYKRTVASLKKLQGESAAKESQIKLAEIGIRKAEIVLQMHDFRSPVAGVIRAIVRGPGEGVKALETVVEITPKKK